MKKTNNDKKDKLMSGPSTTGSYGISTDGNMTTEAAGTEGDESHSLFPDFPKAESWSSKTTSITYKADMDRDVSEADVDNNEEE